MEGGTRSRQRRPHRQAIAPHSKPDSASPTTTQANSMSDLMSDLEVLKLLNRAQPLIHRVL
jgi:hypothetical protein